MDALRVMWILMWLALAKIAIIYCPVLALLFVLNAISLFSNKVWVEAR